MGLPSERSTCPCQNLLPYRLSIVSRPGILALTSRRRIVWWASDTASGMKTSTEPVPAGCAGISTSYVKEKVRAGSLSAAPALRAAAIDIPSTPVSIARRLFRTPEMGFPFRLFATPALAKRRGRSHLPLFQLTAWTPPRDASRYCMSLNAIGGGAGMRQIQPVIHGNARRAGLHLSDHRGAGESLVAKQ